MSLELESAIQDSQEAQRIASELAIKRDELRQDLEQANLLRKQLSLETAKVWESNRGWSEAIAHCSRECGASRIPAVTVGLSEHSGPTL